MQRVQGLCAAKAMFILVSAFAGCDATTPQSAADATVDAGTDASVSRAPLPFRPECENINAYDCLLPWPSQRFLSQTATSRTGFRVDIPEAAMPRNTSGARFAPGQFSRFDGFSPIGSIVTVFPGNVDTTNLADEAHIQDSLGTNSPTVLLELGANGQSERVAHFAELDMWPQQDANFRPFYIRPATRLKENTRYVVGIRNIRLQGGATAQPSDYFRALKGESVSLAPDAMADVTARREREDFATVFSALEGAGVPRNELIEAWSFRTGAGETLWGNMVRMRDEGLRQVVTSNACTIRSSVDNPDDKTLRRVEGTVRIPLFLNSQYPDTADGARLHRDADGNVIQNGFADVPFTLVVPKSLEATLAAGTSAPLMMYGHGLFGSQEEVTYSWFKDMLQTTQMVAVGLDWWGMSTADLGRVAGTLQDLSTFDATAERLQQGLLNFILTPDTLASCTDLAELSFPRNGGRTALYRASERYFYGVSQGGIMGTALAALDPKTTRYTLGVGGIAYTIMIPRSSNWRTYSTFMALGYPDAFQRSVLMTMVQTLWDVSDPATYAPHVLRDFLPCSSCGVAGFPERSILMQVGQDDAQVPNIASDIAARTMGLRVLERSAYTGWNLQQTRSPSNSAQVNYAIAGTMRLALGTRDPGPGPHAAHDGVRRLNDAIEQMKRFFTATGRVEDTCNGPCD